MANIPVISEEEMDKYPKSDSIYCPNCGAIYRHNDLQATTESVFSYRMPDMDPGYDWTELIKCNKCETSYTIKNGT